MVPSLWSTSTRAHLASLGSECANTVYELPHVRIRVIASGTVRRCAERLTPSVQAHPELFTPDGCGSPLPGRTMPPAPRPHVRAARATGLSFLRGLVCEPEVVVSRIPFARAVFLRLRLRDSGPPEGKEAGLFPASAYGRRLIARVVPFGRTLLVPLPICSPRPAGADQAV